MMCRGRPQRHVGCRRRSASCLRSLRAYPQLKADKNFLELQNQLAEIEDQLQMARRYYKHGA
jgi:hypothetical protein